MTNISWSSGIWIIAVACVLRNSYPRVKLPQRYAKNVMPADEQRQQLVPPTRHIIRGNFFLFLLFIIKEFIKTDKTADVLTSRKQERPTANLAGSGAQQQDHHGQARHPAATNRSYPDPPSFRPAMSMSCPPREFSTAGDLHRTAEYGSFQTFPRGGNREPGVHRGRPRGGSGLRSSPSDVAAHGERRRGRDSSLPYTSVFACRTF